MKDTNEKILYAVWGLLYILCAGLGFVSEPEGLAKGVLVITALLFFVPGAVLVYRGVHEKEKGLLVRVRITAAVSLSLTLVLLIVNFMSVTASAQVGNVLYALLVLVSAPMICSQYWVMSLFLWACLLMASFTRLPAQK